MYATTKRARRRRRPRDRRARVILTVHATRNKNAQGPITVSLRANVRMGNGGRTTTSSKSTRRRDNGAWRKSRAMTIESRVEASLACPRVRAP